MRHQHKVAIYISEPGLVCPRQSYSAGHQAQSIRA